MTERAFKLTLILLALIGLMMFWQGRAWAGSNFLSVTSGDEKILVDYLTKAGAGEALRNNSGAQIIFTDTAGKTATATISDNAPLGFIDCPSTGASVWGADSADFELASNKYLALGILFERNALNEDKYWSVFGKNNDTTPNLSYGLTVSDAADNRRARFWVDSTGNGSNITVISSPNNILEKTGVLSLVAEYKSVGVNTSGLTLWACGSTILSVNGVSTAYNGTAPLSIGSFGIGSAYSHANIKVYSAWIAFADIPIVVGAPTSVTSWVTGASTYPFAASGVSRAWHWSNGGIVGPTWYSTDLVGVAAHDLGLGTNSPTIYKARDGKKLTNVQADSGFSANAITKFKILRPVSPREQRRHRTGAWRVVWDSSVN